MFILCLHVALQSLVDGRFETGLHVMSVQTAPIGQHI